MTRWDYQHEEMKGPDRFLNGQQKNDLFLYAQETESIVLKKIVTMKYGFLWKHQMKNSEKLHIFFCISGKGHELNIHVHG